MSTRRGLFVLAGVLLAVCGCGARQESAPPPPPQDSAVMLNTVSVDAVLAAIRKANLPVVNTRDATASRCPEAGCVQATDTDTVSILKFPNTGRAELYAAGVRDMLQVEDIVVLFAPTLTNEQKSAYGQAVKNVMLTQGSP